MDTKEFGHRVAGLRRLRGMSQGELATAINRSESWVSQVERGVYPAERLSVLQSLADALGVSVQELRSDAPQESTPVDEGQRQPSLDELRLAMSGHPALSELFGATEATDVNLPALESRVDRAWSLEHSGEYAELYTVLPSTLVALERASRQVGAPDRPKVLALERSNGRERAHQSRPCRRPTQPRRSQRLQYGVRADQRPASRAVSGYRRRRRGGSDPKGGRSLARADPRPPADDARDGGAARAVRGKATTRRPRGTGAAHVSRSVSCRARRTGPPCAGTTWSKPGLRTTRC
jgi:transcriptional regulator with XRE-family HTH domain